MAPRTKFTPTPQQQAIVASVADGASVFCEAGAGTAKSSTLELAAPGVKGPALALAFNRAIAQELGPRLPQNFATKTFNGLGHGAWLRGNPRVTKWDLQPQKLGRLVTQVAKDRQLKLSSDQWEMVRELVRRAMMAGLVPAALATGQELVPDTTEAWVEAGLEAGYDEDLVVEWVDFGRMVLEESIALARAGVISFDDQVYCPTVLGGQWPRFPTILVDEAQDLSGLNRRMIELASGAQPRLVVVGDPRQSIYAFRGADHSSMPNLRALRQQWDHRELSVTFRCPRAIVERQQQHYPGYTAAPSVADGRVVTLRSSRDEGGHEAGWQWRDVMAELPRPGSTMAVLCRNNGPLFALAFKLLRAGIGVVMLGRDIGKGLEVLSRKLAPEDATPADAVEAAVAEWRQSEVSKAIANGHDERVAGITDRAECLEAVLQNAAVRDAGELRAMLRKLFARVEGTVTLGSIHRSKGLEWDLVLHLDPWRVPSKQARRAAAAGDTRALKQEWNLKYVCETRTKHTLVEANLEDFLA